MHTHYYITHYEAFASYREKQNTKQNEKEESNEANERKKPIGSELEYASSERVHQKRSGPCHVKIH